MQTKVFSLLAASAFALTACVGNAPSPETEPSNIPADEISAKAQTDSTGAPQTSELQGGTGNASNQSLDNYRLATPENIPAATTEASPIQSEKVTEEPNASASVPDPYTAIPAIIQSIFDHADALYKAGYTDSATAYLERFRVIKPLWAQWETKADSMLNEFGKTRAEKAKEFEPLVLTIQNMNRAKASFSLVEEVVDSLIALSPGDSLVNWAKIQWQNAFANTLEKAKKEYAQIKSLADDKGQFDEALKKAEEFRLRYGDFADTIQIQGLIDHIRELVESANSGAAKYWETHDPKEALAKADTLIQKEKFSEAKEILNKLKFSSLRKDAIEKFNKLADTFCTKQRTATSQLFGKAQKQKDPAKKKKMLLDAIAPLDKCLTEYPDNPQKQKVIENKQFLEKEAAR